MSNPETPQKDDASKVTPIAAGPEAPKKAEADKAEPAISEKKQA